ncbi:2'-5' RNA ligase [Vulcanibacillus modesticaldus]|uniref:RNA 2',3'-cyclic phosphodiesterase n=1 Tax=Vulcanibacillus modesticaldus TaxID=337097 RepID=A0A1D2YWH4_9BACI|nr:RNA 2',3'-cyclic phosphodiesterase [Vulcanibacillus modesticaldus]OEG00052.1 2'-5' RNA ligase [Vulcanibacillus modesticaldus]
MRLFITINMSSQVKEEIVNLMPNIKLKFQGGRWVPKENMHITMLYLGEVPDEKLGSVDKAMFEAIKGIDPFELWVEGIGAFPNTKKPNILWAGVQGELKFLIKLYRQLLKEVQNEGLPYDAKPHFKPHLTLARKISTIANDDDIFLKTSSWRVDSLELYQSIFINGGVKYKRLLSKKF